MHSGALYYFTRVDINCERANDLCARANYLCARKTASRARKLPQRAQNSLSRKMFLRSLKFNFGTMGEGIKAGRAFL